MKHLIVSAAALSLAFCGTASVASAKVAVCHDKIQAENGKVITDEKGHALIATEHCSWYRHHHVRHYWHDRAHRHR